MVYPQEKLKEYIKNSGLIVGHIAEKVGVSRTTFYLLIKKPWKFTYDQATTLQKLLGISASDMAKIFCI